MYRLDEKDFLIKYKARICARGYLQPRIGEEIYAATGKCKKFRMFMTVVAAFDLDCHQMDAVNIF